MEEENKKAEEHIEAEKKEEHIVNSDSVEEKNEVTEEKVEEEKVEEKKEEEVAEVKEEKIEEEKPTEEEKPVEEKKEEEHKVEEKEEVKEPSVPIKKRILNFYDKQYKKLMIIPILMFILAVLVIGMQTARTGSFINKDVSLKGGVTLTITKAGAIDVVGLESLLKSKFSENDISVRSIRGGGTQIGTIIVADIDGTDKDRLSSFIAAVEEGIGFELGEEDYSIEIMGSSLGESFFKETIIALLIAFVLMSLVILIYFRSIIPSLGVIVAAFSDIIVTLAIVNLTGMKLSTGGIAAFLMLIGYSVDTNVLLNTRVLKRTGGEVFDRVVGAVKTGMMMTITTIGALGVGIIFVKSDIIRQIMIIVLIGLFVDMVNTWIQNVGILRYYLEKKKNE